MEEIWKDIPGFEEYQISNMGRIFSKKTNTVLKPAKDTKGYLRISFYKHGKGHTFKVHRLVGQAFIPNPNGFTQVNHKDEDKQNNTVENLEWCSNTYNHEYGTRNKRVAIAMTNHKSSSVPVRCIETNVIYPSISEARRQTGVNNIENCCAKKRNMAGGFHWEYATSIRRIKGVVQEI